MSRGLAANNLTEVNKDSIGVTVLFAELDFASGFVRVHSALGTITWGGFDWLGVGTLGTVSTVEESAELKKRTLVYTLTGVPNALITTVFTETYQGRSAKLYIGFLDPNTGQLVATPELLDRGRMDASGITVGGECSVTISAENRISAWDRPVVRRYTNSEQQDRFASDKGLEFIDQAAQKEINWGRKTQ